MATRQQIETFFQDLPLAVVGVSRNPQKFGYQAYQSLKQRGVPVYAINPNADRIGEDVCYPDLETLPHRPGGLVLVVPPAQSEAVVRQAAALGITNIWMQPGAESAGAVAYCRQNGMNAIVGECIMMHNLPVNFPHSLHRWVNKISGKLPR